MAQRPLVATAFDGVERLAALVFQMGKGFRIAAIATSLPPALPEPGDFPNVKTLWSKQLNTTEIIFVVFSLKRAAYGSASPTVRQSLHTPAKLFFKLPAIRQTGNTSKRQYGKKICWRAGFSL